ncbi:MAG: hypothetical protein PWP34_858 [Desulfuromonadales bacterium]|jgi:hypothetical protein|nr:hypothetical protein [Desulfuromonadales bacterium]
MSSSRFRIEGVQHILQQWLASRGMDANFSRYRVWQYWDAAVGKQIAARAKPVRLRGSVLEVRVDHPVWMQQLQLLKPRILTRLNEQLGEHLIDDLFLRHGRNAHYQSEENQDSLPGHWQNEPLSEKERQDIEKSLAHLEDQELRRHLRHLMEMQLRLDKARRSKSQSA